MDNTTIDLSKSIFAAIDRVEERLEAMARLGLVNSQLSAANFDLVLPSPAVSLMQISTPSVIRLGPHTLARSMEAIGPTGEVLLSPVGTDITIQPLELTSVEWIGDGEEAEDDAFSTQGGSDSGEESSVVAGKSADVDAESTGSLSLIRGLRLRCRGQASPGASLSLRLSGHLPSSVFDPLVATVNGSRAAVDRPGRRLLATTLGEPRHVVLSHLESTLSGVLLVSASNTNRWGADPTIELHFGTPVPGTLLPSSPEVHINVIPVWNSVSLRYPDDFSAEQTISESRHRVVHPLTPSSLGDGWSTWTVDRVGSLRSLNELIGTVPVGSLRLAYLPVQSDADRRREGSSLALVIDSETQTRLHGRGDHLAARFQATTGSCANGVPATTRFHLLHPESSLDPIAEGTLVTTSRGGMDGIRAETMDELYEDGRIAALRDEGRRTIGDVLVAFERVFGEHLVIHEPADLLRANDGRLTVRARLLGGTDQGMDFVPVAQRFLERYLTGSGAGDVQIVLA